MERELIDRRRWPWKIRKNFNGLSTGSSESASSPAPVKLFDEQEVARILQDQVRTADDQLVEALQAAEAKYSQKEKALNLKIAAGNEKLTSALAEITIKDNLVKQHIKVAEEAVVGWEKAETEAAEYKAELEDAIQQRRATEDRAKHLDGALKELMQQLHCGREEHEKQLHETIVKKTREFDKVRLEMEAKLAEASKSLSDNRTHMIELKAENEAINHALQDRSRMIADLNDIRAHVESENKILRVRFDGLEKENFDLKYKIHTVTKELEIRSAELEYGKKASDVMSRHHADSLKKIARLEEECNRLRMMVRKKLPNPAAIVRMKQELDSLAKEAGESATPRHRRRQGLLRSQSGGVDFLPINELVVVDEAQDLREANAERIANMDEETRMLKEALAKRNDQLQSARLMCAKTASRLTAVEDELETLKAASADSGLISRENSISKETSSVSSSSSSLPVSESISKRVPWKDGVPKLEPSKNSVEMEPFTHSRSSSEPQLSFKSFVLELAVENSSGISPQQQRIADLEKALAANYRDYQAANRTCYELRAQLTTAEKQFAVLQARNAANEQSVIALQDRLDKLLESQVMAAEHPTNSADAASPGASISQLQMEFATTAKSVFQATESLARAVEIHNISTAEAEDAVACGSIAIPIRWKDSKLDSSMSSLSMIANKLLESESDVHSVLSFMSELSSTLTCITGLSSLVIKDLRKDSEAVRLCLDSANAQLSQLQEITDKTQEDRAASEIQMEVELNRISGLEREVAQLQTEKAEALRQVSDVVSQLLEAKEKVEALSDQLKEAEVLIAELRLQTDHQKQEDELIEEELLELSSSHPGLAKTMRAADAEMNELHSKLASLEVELLGERRRHHDVVAKLEDLQQQIHRGVGRICPSSRSLHSDEITQPFITDEAGNNARQEREIAAAALAECQRTILALGKQLKILGFSEFRELTVRATDSPESIKRMTETMELLRWHAESGHQGPPQVKKSSTAESIADGPVSVPASPARSDHLEAPSTPESPATSTVRRSVRTIRPFQLPKVPGTNCNGEVILPNPNESVEPSKTAAAYTRFHTRSPSESSLSSGHSNGN